MTMAYPLSSASLRRLFLTMLVARLCIYYQCTPMFLMGHVNGGKGAPRDAFDSEDYTNAIRTRTVHVRLEQTHNTTDIP